MEVIQVEEKLVGNEQGEIPEFLVNVVQQHYRVFQDQEGLPSARVHVHSIVLKAGGNLISVCPHRYPQCQKNEIERLIQEMLAAGTIKPSNRPFLSPVLLVEK